MSDTDSVENLHALVRRFSNAESALRTLLNAAERFTVARDELTAARRDTAEKHEASIGRLEEARRTIQERLDAADVQAIERLDAVVRIVEECLSEAERGLLWKFAAAEQSLDASQRVLADTASGVYGLTTELKDIARDLKDCTIALRGLDPGRVEMMLGSIRNSNRRIQMTLWTMLGLFLVAGSTSFVFIRFLS